MMRAWTRERPAYLGLALRLLTYFFTSTPQAFEGSFYREGLKKFGLASWRTTMSTDWGLAAAAVLLGAGDMALVLDDA
jgi:hypothetical protein